MNKTYYVSNGTKLTIKIPEQVTNLCNSILFNSDNYKGPSKTEDYLYHVKKGEEMRMEGKNTKSRERN